MSEDPREPQNIYDDPTCCRARTCWPSRAAEVVGVDLRKSIEEVTFPPARFDLVMSSLVVPCCGR